MLEVLRSVAVRNLFGGGVSGTLADRGIDFIVEESRKAIRPEAEHLSSVTLRPGETYTVIARPKASRTERRLADRADALAAKERKLSATHRKQRKAARRLRSAQRRVDRRRPTSRRGRRAQRVEARRARRFDAVTDPSRKLSEVREELAKVTAELEAVRADSFAKASGQRSGAGSTVLYR